MEPNFMLYCLACEKETAHLVNRWQMTPEKFNALSALCLECSRMSILTMEDAMILNTTPGWEV
jgi:hypothetical protein